MSTRIDRIALFLALDPMPNPADPMTWTVEGIPLGADQLRTLIGFTLQDAEDVKTLLRLDLELSRP